MPLADIPGPESEYYLLGALTPPLESHVTLFIVHHIARSHALFQVLQFYAS
jgi:hypothetical protein